MRLILCAGLLGLASAAVAYTNSFTLDFNTAGTTGWSEVNGGEILAAGETTAVGTPAYSPGPGDGAAGANGTGWFRVGAGTQAAGVVTANYNGTAGGSTTPPADYTIEVDMFVVVNPSQPGYRHHADLNARWNNSTNAPFQFFYSHNTPSSANGYGFRNTGGGTATTYNALGVTETSNRWVRLKITVTGTAALVAVDRDLNGTYDHSANVTLGGTAPATGVPGVFSVINDPTNGSARVADQFTFFDNFKYTPGNAGIGDWAVYQ